MKLIEETEQKIATLSLVTFPLLNSMLNFNHYRVALSCFCLADVNRKLVVPHVRPSVA